MNFLKKRIDKNRGEVHFPLNGKEIPKKIEHDDTKYKCKKMDNIECFHQSIYVIISLVAQYASFAIKCITTINIYVEGIVNASHSKCYPNNNNTKGKEYNNLFGGIHASNRLVCPRERERKNCGGLIVM